MEDYDQAASELWHAYASGPIEPIADRLVPNTAEAGYRVQELNTQRWLDSGRVLVGRKIGLTSEAVQRQIGVDQPDFGMLFADMEVADKGAFHAGEMYRPRAEGELAFGVGRDLVDPAMLDASVFDALEWMAPAIEVVDSRILDWRCRIADTVADNASSGRFVVGARQPVDAEQIASLKMTLFEDDKAISEGDAAACMGNPLHAVGWLARKMIELGRPLAAGDIVLSGAFGPLSPIAGGRVYRIEMSGLGSASAHCE